jgi:decaprenylphospho-beta-D-ribofuranose 2-oxidase
VKRSPVMLSGWGNFPRVPCFACHVDRRELLREAILSNDQPHYIARGLGRAYGDSAVNRNAGVIIQTGLNRLIAFDENTGVLESEAGVSFAEIIDVFLPRGWFLPTTPGTKFVTVGGAIAANIHGKNHHRDGSFGRFIEELRLMLADGSEVVCSPTTRPELFWATVGGMGLTGCILSAKFRLKRVSTAYVAVTHHRTRNLDETLELFSNEDQKYQYSVAWIDCLARGEALGRSVVMLADDATVQQLLAGLNRDPLQLPRRLPLVVPIHLPRVAVAPWSMRIFNQLYYNAHKDEIKTVDYNSFFYPLDRIAQWNRIYGRRGFIQYQAWFPKETSRRGLIELLERISTSQKASFLAVLKSCGEADAGLLSYLQPGHTLALDFANTGTDIQKLCGQLDQILLKYGGRLYLAKDSLTTAECFRQMYPRLREFQAVKSTVDPNGRFNSSQARRVGIVENSHE